MSLPRAITPSRAHALIHSRRALLGAIVVLLGGSITEICAFDWKSWLGGAILIRTGVGLAQSILIVYVSELAPFQVRGFMIGAYQLFIAVGQLLSAISTQLVVIHRPMEWRPLIATEFIFSGVSPPNDVLQTLEGLVPDPPCSTDSPDSHMVCPRVPSLSRSEGRP